MCNIQNKTYETYIWTTYTAAELDAHDHPSREQQMAHTDAGLCSSHDLPGLAILSLVIVHSMVTLRMHGPTHRMHRMLSEWSHALPSADPDKDKCGPHLTTTTRASLFYGLSHRAGRGRQTNILNQALPFQYILRRTSI
jgi:hypothetical protein